MVNVRNWREEFKLLTAELSYLPERPKAFENLAERTGLEAVQGLGHQPQRSPRNTAPRLGYRCAFWPRRAAINA